MHDDSTTPTEPVEVSRSQRRRDALATLALAETLVVTPRARLAQLDLPEHVRTEIGNARAINAHGARKRQLAYLAKLLRREDDAWLETVRSALSADKGRHRAEVAAAHRLEHLRERLLTEGDTVIAELATQHPALDRQRLRSLVRQAAREQQRGKPPHAAREILRFLRTLED